MWFVPARGGLVVIRRDSKSTVSPRSLEGAAGGDPTSLEVLRDWYAHGLRSKVTRAVDEGRVDPRRARELHRLMTQLLEDEQDIERKAA
jgi:hypothetical protein